MSSSPLILVAPSSGAVAHVVGGPGFVVELGI